MCRNELQYIMQGRSFLNQKITQMAVTAASDHKTVMTPVPPCGACRQTIAEYEVGQQTPIEIYFMGETGKVIKSDSLKDLLPLIFDGSALS